METSQTVYFDRDFNIINGYDEDGFTLTLVSSEYRTGLHELNVTITKNRQYTMEDIDKSTIFTLNTAIYMGAGD
jgi:hypothetical protein